VQYKWVFKNKGLAECMKLLDHFARTLSGPIYGNQISFKDAKDLISSSRNA